MYKYKCQCKTAAKSPRKKGKDMEYPVKIVQVKSLSQIRFKCGFYHTRQFLLHVICQLTILPLV